jgi:hypothetical protein
MLAFVAATEHLPVPRAAAPAALPPGVPQNAPRFRRRGGVTVKLETAPAPHTPGVVYLIKGGQRRS